MMELIKLEPGWLERQIHATRDEIRTWSIGTGANMDQQTNNSPRTPPPAAYVREDIYTLSEGNLVVRYPSRITSVECDEIEEFFTLIATKMRRMVRDG